MKRYLGTILIVATVSFFVSCQQEIDDTLPFVSSSDSVLSRIVVLDTTFPTGVDTTQTVNFTYDASGRLSKYNSIYYNTGVAGPGRLQAGAEVIYQYTGAQLLPVKLVETYTDFASPLVDIYTSYLSYTDGYVSKDSFVNNSGGYYVSRIFSKLSNTRYKLINREDDGAGGQIVDSGYIYVNWQNGNLVKEIDSLWQVGGTWSVQSMNITYDTKINPFQPFSIPYPAPFFQSLPPVGIPDFPLPSVNNEISEINDVGGSIILSYQYGPTGLPKIVVEEERKRFYQYKKL